ncbi:hypothetical protein [Urbifossiella limnaea]|uniref:Uncharacterized protein n=1 Tax=Urbifossiella limnaea TaxID=2528023 RepID=A0A517Y2P7_9BACT|nr:hypothetical protein [Urbifossiella limnaea]QDU24047.1 hypothetical protein ETAA1_60580 [Urbifossiella limnaea]
MSTLGKVLLVLNLLVGGGFAYLALQDWQGRQTITAAGLRHNVLLNGLPLGGSKDDPETMPTDAEAEIPFVVTGPGGKPTSTVSAALLKDYFKAAGGGAAPGGLPLAGADAVPNQLAEVRRVYGLVKAQVEAQPAVAFELLKLQAETLDERQQFQALNAANKTDELRDRLYARFDRVLKAPDAKPDTSAIDAPADAEDAKKTEERLDKAGVLREGPTKDEGERRARLAHLLAHLDQSAAWQKRVLMVVGARRYARTVAAQAVRLGEMVTRVQHLTADDQNTFVGEYSTLRRLAIDRTQRLRDVTDQEVRMAAEESRNADAVKALETQLDDPTVGLKAQLTQVKADVSKMLAQQNLTEQELFAIQRQVAQTLDEIYRMEAALTNVERQRYSNKK